MSKHADEPLCVKCFEDRYDLVTMTKDGGIVTWFCAMCGHSWHPPADVRDVNGVMMEAGE